jgi:hypothetical protein
MTTHRLGALVAGSALAVGVSWASAAGAAVADETVTAQVTTANPRVDQPLVGTGRVANATTYPVTVMITRDDSAGTATPVGSGSVQTKDNQGNFDWGDQPPVRGSVTYHFIPQDSAAPTEVTVSVAGKASKLTLSTPHAIVTTGQAVSVTAHVAAPAGAPIAIYAHPYQQSQVKVTEGSVDGNGQLRGTYKVVRRTTFSARFAGDSTYEPATATRLVKARGVVRESLRGGYGSAHGYRLFHSGAEPLLVGRLLPAAKNACLYFRAQHYYRGGWHTSTVSGCIRTDAEGYAAGALTGDHAVGEPYRIRSEWRGNRALLARNGAWLRLKFQR